MRALVLLTSACTAYAARVFTTGNTVKATLDTEAVDDLKPFTGYYTSSKLEYDPLTRYAEVNGGNTSDAQLLIKMLESAAAINPDNIAMRQPYMDEKGGLVKRETSRAGPGGTYEYREYSWKEYYEAVLDAAAAFKTLGLKTMDSVHIRGVNSPEWMIAFLGCVAAGGLPVGLYPTDSPQTLEFKAKDSGAAFVVVGKVKDLKVYSKFVDKIDTLKALVHWDFNFRYPDNVDADLAAQLSSGGRQLFSWKDFITVGQEAVTERADVVAGVDEQLPGQAGTVVYTSGTTGNPKGVMLSQDGLTWSYSICMKHIFRPVGDICHTHVKGSVARLSPSEDGRQKSYICKCDYPHGLTGEDEKCKSSIRKFDPWEYDGCRCANSEEKEGPGEDQSADPNLRVVTYLPLNHIAGQMLDIVTPLGWTQKKAGQAATLYFPAGCFLKKTCFVEQLNDAQPTLFLGVPAVWNGLKAKIEMATAGGIVGVVASIAPSVILNKMGLGSVEVAVSGAGPITKDTLSFFHGMGIKILNVYGQSESSALGTFWTRDDYARFDFKAQFGSIGRIRGNEMRITNPDSEGRGEIELRGRNVMMGYLNNPSKTKGAFSDDGWLLTGDQGMIDEDGFVFLTGRIKEIMKDMGGEMILPVQVEEGVKKACNKPLKTIINEVIVVGDGEYFISALLTLMEKKPEGIPSGQLEGYAKKVDPAAQTVAQAKTSELWATELETCIGEYNKVAAKSQERVFRYYILPKDITPEDAPDMMTPTLKIKRTGVVAGYSEQIKACGGDKELTDRSIVPCTTD